MPDEEDGIEYLEPDEYPLPKAIVVRPSDNFMPVMTLDDAMARRASIVGFVGKILTEGLDADYAVIPGSKKKVLLKAGAEKLANFFGLSPLYERVDEKMDLTGRDYGEPLYYVCYKCTLMRNGHIMAQGEGSANSLEAKFRYRWVQEKDLPPGANKEALPKRGSVITITEFEFGINKAETTGKYGKPAEYWERFKRAIESGEAKKGERDTSRGKSVTWSVQEDATLYRINNPEMPDVINTCQKLGQKRAFVSAVLGATGASQFFTPDLEDSLEAPPPSSQVDHGEPEDRKREDLTVKTKESEKASKPQVMPSETTKKDDPNKDIKASNRALLQRIWLDMDITEDGETKKDLLTEYYLGFLGVNIIPTGNPGLFEIPLKALDDYQTHNPGTAKTNFLANPRALGERLLREWTQTH